MPRKQELEEDENTDWTNRRPKKEFWIGLKDIVDTLSGRPKDVPRPEAPLFGWKAKDKKRGLI